MSESLENLGQQYVAEVMKADADEELLQLLLLGVQDLTKALQPTA